MLSPFLCSISSIYPNLSILYKNFWNGGSIQSKYIEFKHLHDVPEQLTTSILPSMADHYSPEQRHTTQGEAHLQAG